MRREHTDRENLEASIVATVINDGTLRRMPKQMNVDISGEPNGSKEGVDGGWYKRTGDSSEEDQR